MSIFGVNSVSGSPYFKGNSKKSIPELPQQPLAGLVSTPKTPKQPKPTVHPPLAGSIVMPKLPKLKPTMPNPMAGSINLPNLYDRPGYKPDGTPIDPEEVKEAVAKVLGKNYDAVA